MLAKLEEDSKRKLAEATLAELEPIPLESYNYGDAEIILGQITFQANRPFQKPDDDRKNTRITVPWVGY